MKYLVSQGCSDAGHGSCCSGHEAVPVSVDAQVVPVDPGQSGGEVRGVPVNAARGPQLTSQTLKTNQEYSQRPVRCQCLPAQCRPQAPSH